MKAIFKCTSALAHCHHDLQKGPNCPSHGYLSFETKQPIAFIADSWFNICGPSGANNG
jgi:hypothetical protein